MELHEALALRELTSLRVARRAEALHVRLGRDFDGDVDFADYARSFQVDQTPCTSALSLGDAASRELLDAAGAGPALARLEELLRAGGHEMLTLDVHARLGIRAENHVHSSVLGRNNGHHAIRAGGIRRHAPDEPELDVQIDGLNLGRGMSFKNAAAGIPFGGCKMTVQSAPIALDDAERLGFLAWCIDRGHFFTGPDMGFPPELADVLRARFTRNIVGGPAGSLGPTGTPTAHGTHLAIVELAAHLWGAPALSGRSFAVQGLGAVGLPLARLLAQAGGRLIVADTDAARLERARAEIRLLEVVPSDEILDVACDVLVPAAVGGVLDVGRIDRLRCRGVCGPANNQLRAVSRDEEIRLARRLRDRGVVYVPEWTCNVAGVVAGYEEYLHGGNARMERVLVHVAGICGPKIGELLARAAQNGQTPTELAYADVERLLDPASPSVTA